MNYLTFEYFSSLFPKARVRKYAKGQIICYQGDAPQNVFFVVSGHIRLYDIDNNGNEKVLHIIGPGNIFPMLFAYGISPDVGSFYSTIDPVEVLAIPVNDFRQALQSDVKFSNRLTKWFLTEIDQLVYRINSFERTDAKNKVLHALKYLAQHYGKTVGEWREIDFPLTQQFIADFTGLTRETVSNAINELEHEKVLSSAKRKTVAIKSKLLI